MPSRSDWKVGAAEFFFDWVNPFVFGGPLSSEREASMTKNVGNWDRIARALGAVGLGVAALSAPLPSWALILLGVNAVYLMLTSVCASCAGYGLLGKSTCAIEAR